MFLSRLTLSQTRAAYNWLSNPYRIHQRLKMACEQDPRLLFRVEETDGTTQILVQSNDTPRWASAFTGLDVLLGPPETKQFSIQLQAGKRYRFRLLANPTAKKTIPTKEDEKRKARVGLFKEADQHNWLERKMNNAGATIITFVALSKGSQFSYKKSPGGSSGAARGTQTHFAVLFEGVLEVNDPALLEKAVVDGVGSGKGFGFGLLSLAPLR